MVAYLRDVVALAFPILVGMPMVIGLESAKSLIPGLGLAFLFGSAVTAIGLTLLGLIGVPLNVMVLTILLLLWFGVWGWLLQRRARRWPVREGFTLPSWRPPVGVLVLLTTINLATAGVYALATPVAISDVINVWLPKADALARTHSLLELARTTFPDYPPLWPVHLFLARSLAGHAGAVKLLPAIYLASMLAAIFGYLSSRATPLIAAVAVWVISGIPYLWFPYGVNDLMAEVPFTALLVISTLGLVRYIEEGDLRQLASAVVLATAATLTRPEGIQHAILLAIVAGAVVWRRRRWTPVIGAGLLAPVFAYVVWHLAIQIVPHARGYAVDPQRVLQVVTPGAIVDIITYTVTWLANPFVFGPIVVAAAICVVGYRSWRTSWPWLLIFGLDLAAIVATYLVAPASNDQPLSWWLATGYKRLLLHIVPLLFVAAATATAGFVTAQADSRPREGTKTPGRNFAVAGAIATSLGVAAMLTVLIPGPGNVLVAGLIPNGVVSLSPGIGFGRQTADGIVDDSGRGGDWIRLQVQSSARGSITYDLNNLGQRSSPNDDVVGRFTGVETIVAAAPSAAHSDFQVTANDRVVASTRPPVEPGSTSVRGGIPPDARTLSLVAAPAAGGSSVQVVWIRAELIRGGAWPLVAGLLLLAAALVLVGGFPKRVQAPTPALPRTAGEGMISRRRSVKWVVALIVASALIQQGDVLTNQAVPLWSEGAHTAVHALRSR